VSTSFRDPSGQVLASRHRILRLVNAEGRDLLLAFLNSKVGQQLVEAGLIVGTEPLDDVDAAELRDSGNLPLAAVPGGSYFEHERVPFPSFPFEWPPEMLHAAGVLTLDIALRCLEAGLGLKDATPYNVLFRGPRPVFVDLLSFEKRDPRDPIWLAYAQFTRNFTLPLLVNRHLGLPLDQIFQTRREGLEPAEAYRLLGTIRRLLPPFLSLVTIPTWLGAFEGEKLYRPRRDTDPERAKFVLESLLKSLERKLRRLAPRPSESQWSKYMGKNCSYTGEQLARKTQFVEASLERCAPSTLLDIGCNTGFFSIMAAKRGARVVALDSDPMVVGRLWREASSHKLDILPLVADISRPSPGLGWRNRECPPLVERLRGGFDTVLMLALIHHLLVTERIPLSEVVDLAAELTTRYAVIEYIGPGDAMFQRLTRGRDALHQSLTRAAFEQAWTSRFEILSSCELPDSTRALYLLGRKG
jgi:SAM-dependent methyltransferase